DRRFLSLRNPKALGAFRVQATILEAFASTLRAEGFTEVKTSKLVATGTEGGSGLFEVDYFGQRAFLAQSPQFYKQAMVASGLERVFEIGQAYRAEKHDTPRHLNEYCSLDLELAFIESELDLIELERRLLASIFEAVAAHNAPQLAAWGASVPSPEELAKAPVLAHDEAIEIAGREGGSRAFEITPEVERSICSWSERERGSGIVFVNEFPRRQRPFYAFPKGRSTMSFDCLFRGLEVTTGGRRINDYAMLMESLERSGLDESDYADYASIFRYGCPPHGGFAIGLERLTQKIMGFPNVRQASLFPRDRRRLRP
ncbi:MAG TPA: aspartate--tRNA(Asn) ligase, partial [Rectinemataceae bacterium]|nr:aspartate--tRNA(Asn) ligase [Rectinemataceae bacterium]